MSLGAEVGLGGFRMFYAQILKVSFGRCGHRGVMIVSARNATPPNSTKSRKSDVLVSRGTNSK